MKNLLVFWFWLYWTKRTVWRVLPSLQNAHSVNKVYKSSHFVHHPWMQICVCVYAPLGEGNGTPLQYSCLENPMDGGAWWATVHGIAKSRTRLSNFTFTFHFHASEKEMATRSSVLAWSIPGTGEPGGLPSMGSHRVGHDWSDLAVAVRPTRLTQGTDCFPIEHCRYSVKEKWNGS